MSQHYIVMTYRSHACVGGNVHIMVFFALCNNNNNK